MKRLASVFRLVRSSLLVLCSLYLFLAGMAPVLAHAPDAGMVAVGPSPSEIEHRLTALEVQTASINDLVRALVFGVGALVLETAGRVILSAGRRVKVEG